MVVLRDIDCDEHAAQLHTPRARDEFAAWTVVYTGYEPQA